MEPKDHERIAHEWLDTALKQYGEAEPRTGLEGRVLANLRAEAERVPEPGGWRPVLIAAVAIVAVAGMIFLGRTRPEAKKVAATVEMPAINQPQTSVTPEHKPGMKVVSERAATRTSARTKPGHVVEAGEPRLAQFPAPRALSEQEILLAKYAAQFHEEALLVAKEQAEANKQDELEMQRRLSESQPRKLEGYSKLLRRSE